MCHHSSNYIPGMNINGDQSTQDVSCKFRKLSTNQGCQFVQVLGKTKYKVFHYSFSRSCPVFAFCSKVNEISLFLLKRAKRTCPQKTSTLSRVSFLTRSHFVRFLSLGLVLISEKNNNTLVVYMTIFFRSEANSFPGSVRFRGKEREGLWVRVCFVTTAAFVTLRNRLYKKQNVRMRMKGSPSSLARSLDIQDVNEIKGFKEV